MNSTMKELRDMKWVEGRAKGRLVFTAQQLDIIDTAFAGTQRQAQVRESEIRLDEAKWWHDRRALHKFGKCLESTFFGNDYCIDCKRLAAHAKQQSDLRGGE